MFTIILYFAFLDQFSAFLCSVSLNYSNCIRLSFFFFFLFWLLVGFNLREISAGFLGEIRGEWWYFPYTIATLLLSCLDTAVCFPYNYSSCWVIIKFWYFFSWVLEDSNGFPFFACPWVLQDNFIPCCFFQLSHTSANNPFSNYYLNPSEGTIFFYSFGS